MEKNKWRALAIILIVLYVLTTLGILSLYGNCQIESVEEYNVLVTDYNLLMEKYNEALGLLEQCTNLLEECTGIISDIYE
ncbi:hypothetical protein ES702_01260 [subsurface metagenome]